MLDRIRKLADNCTGVSSALNKLILDHSDKHDRCVVVWVWSLVVWSSIPFWCSVFNRENKHRPTKDCKDSASTMLVEVVLDQAWAA